MLIPTLIITMNINKVYNTFKVIEFIFFLILFLASLCLLSNNIYYSCDIYIQLWILVNFGIWFLLFVFGLLSIKIKYLILANTLYIITLSVFVVDILAGYYLVFSKDNCGDVSIIMLVSLIIESIIFIINCIILFCYFIKLVYSYIQLKLSINNEINDTINDNTYCDEYIDYIFKA